MFAGGGSVVFVFILFLSVAVSFGADEDGDKSIPKTINWGDQSYVGDKTLGGYKSKDGLQALPAVVGEPADATVRTMSADEIDAAIRKKLEGRTGDTGGTGYTPYLTRPATMPTTQDQYVAEVQRLKAELSRLDPNSKEHYLAMKEFDKIVGDMGRGLTPVPAPVIPQVVQRDLPVPPEVPRQSVAAAPSGLPDSRPVTSNPTQGPIAPVALQQIPQNPNPNPLPPPIQQQTTVNPPGPNSQDIVGGVNPTPNNGKLPTVGGEPSKETAAQPGLDVMRTHRSDLPSTDSATKVAAIDPNNGTTLEPVPREKKPSPRIEQEISRAAKALEDAVKNGDQKTLVGEISNLEKLAAQEDDPISSELRQRLNSMLSRYQEKALSRVGDTRSDFSANSVMASVPRVMLSSSQQGRFEERASLLEKMIETKEVSTVETRALTQTIKKLLDESPSLETTKVTTTASIGYSAPLFAVVDVPLKKTRGMAARLLNKFLTILATRSDSKKTTHLTKSGKVETVTRDKFRLPAIVAGFFSGTPGEETDDPLEFSEDSYGALFLMTSLMGMIPSLAFLYLAHRKLTHLSAVPSQVSARNKEET